MQAIVASAAIVLNDHFQSLFKQANLLDYHLGGLILLTIVGMKLADQGANFLVDHLRFVRRLLAGEDDIEGYWVDVDINLDNPDQIRFVEFCKIWYRKGQYIISGDSWTVDGAWVQEFSSIGGIYENKTLIYAYRAAFTPVGGYGVITFSPHDSRPTDFMCRYQDDNSRTRHITRGRRIAAGSRNLSPDQRRELALEFAKQFEQQKLLSLIDAVVLFK